MEEFLIAESAWRSIESAALAVRGAVETGGLLVGARSRPSIVAATKPGPRAEREACRYTGDHSHDQAALNALRSQFDGQVGWVGGWHLHSNALLQHCSHGDLRQAREVVAHLGRPFLVVIAVVQRSGFEGSPSVTLNAFELRPGDEDFRAVTLRRVPDDSPEVREALDQEPASAPVAQMDYWNDMNFNFYLTPRGRARIQAEIADLRAAGFHVTPLRRERDGRLMLEIESRLGKIRCIPGPEHPLCPPRLYWPGRKKPIWLFDSVRAWNSDSQILDAVNEALSLFRLNVDVFDIPRLIWRRLAWLRPRL